MTEERMTMKVEVEFGNAEAALIKIIFEQYRNDLHERWEVETMADLVNLLAMHGADNLGDLAGIGGRP